MQPNTNDLERNSKTITQVCSRGGTLPRGHENRTFYEKVVKLRCPARRNRTEITKKSSEAQVCSTASYSTNPIPHLQSGHKADAPMARETVSSPLILSSQHTKPPASWMRVRSLLLQGLWSLLSSIALPPLDRTARESPALATT